jgi:ribosomal protein S12 methylthiotransferase
LVNEAKYLVENGVKELILIGQETTNYKFQYSEKAPKYRFYDLLWKINERLCIENIWIRIMYAHPNTINPNILTLMKENKNICKYIDIPFQHISDNVLENMKRKATKQRTPSEMIKELIEEMRKTVPEIRIRSTFIVGFPGETEKDFKELANFLNEYKLDRVGIFKYSPEIGTKAFYMENQVEEKVKEERFAELMELQQKISFAKNNELLHKKLNILVERDNGEYFAGRTEFDAPEIDNGVFIKKSEKKEIKVGEIQELQVVDFSEYDLICE